MSKIEIVNEDDFEKAFVFPKEYKHFTSMENIKGSFKDARRILTQFKEGNFFVTNSPYEWFLFEIPDKVRVLFYPHKTSCANVHIRARNQSSKDKELFSKVKVILTKNGFPFKESPIGYVSKSEKRKDLAERLNEQWSNNEETMGEMAAYSVACEMLGIDEDDGYDMLAEYCSED